MRQSSPIFQFLVQKWRWVRFVQPFLLLLTAPFLLFAQNFAREWVFAAACCLVVPLVLQRISLGRWTRPTPLHLPIVVLLFVFLPWAVWATPLWTEATLPKLTSLLWAVAIWGWVVDWGWDGQTGNDLYAVYQLSWLFLGMGAVISLVGLATMQRVVKVPLVGAWWDRLPELGWGMIIHQNEVAGTLTLFFPLALSLLGANLWGKSNKTKPVFWRSGTSFQFLQTVSLGLLIGLLGTTLLLTQSRGAWLAIGVAGVAILVWGGKKGKWWLFGGGLIFLCLLFFTSWGKEFLFSLYSDVLLWKYTPSAHRLEIWQRAWLAIGDFPITGMGLGSFRYMMVLLYPWSLPNKNDVFLTVEDVGHAHQLWLQTALDVGIGGVVTFTIILGMAGICLWRLQKLESAGTTNRFWLIGVAGSLLAYLIFSLLDTVALGSKPGFVLWMLLGLIMLAWGQQSPSWSFPHWQKYPFLLAALGLLTIGLAKTDPLNLTAVALAKGLAGDTHQLAKAQIELEQLATENCHANYLLGTIYDYQQKLTERNSYWQQAMGCHELYVDLVWDRAGTDPVLANLAFQQYPQQPTTLFWLADSIRQTEPQRAITLYQQGLILNPDNGYYWAELGHLLVAHNPQAAIEAFLQSCRYGDPPNGGCRSAGKVAEQMGNPQAAISYYERSYRAAVRQLANHIRNGATPNPKK